MSPKLLFFPLLLLLITLTLASSSTSPATESPSSAPTNYNTTRSFIRSSCSSTLYPSLCFHSLSRYSSSIQENPVHIARAASNLTLSRLRSLSSFLRRARAATSPFSSSSDRRFLAVLRDCEESIGDAVDLMRQSVDELGKLDAASGPEVAWRVSNAQTWISGALTNEDTCGDGFEAVLGEGVIGKAGEVCGRVTRVKEFTSNALALVNKLVAS